MDGDTELSAEQQFKLRSLELQAQRMSHEQVQELLVKLYEQMLVRETMYKSLVSHQWGLDPWDVTSIKQGKG